MEPLLYRFEAMQQLVKIWICDCTQALIFATGFEKTAAYFFYVYEEDEGTEIYLEKWSVIFKARVFVLLF
jgi:hypothetical protein